jgi:hypothetical protein
MKNKRSDAVREPLLKIEEKDEAEIKQLIKGIFQQNDLTRTSSFNTVTSTERGHSLTN